MPLAATLEAAHVGQREPRDGDVDAGGLDRREHGERVRYPMPAALRDGEGQLAPQQSGADQAPATFGADRVHGVDVGIAAAEGDDLPGVAPRGLHQAVAVARVVGHDGDPVRLEPLEDLRLGIGDRLLRAEVLEMGRGDCGDDGEVRPDLAGQSCDLAGIVHAHF